MGSTKPASTRPQSRDVFVPPALRIIMHVLIRSISVCRTVRALFERPHKVPHLEPEYYTSWNRTEDDINVDRLIAPYLERYLFLVNSQ